MSNATASTEHAVSAAQAREINKELAVKSELPYVKVTGNTFPCRKALWVMGGDYQKDGKFYLVPAHQAVEAQAMVDRIGAKIVESMAKAAAKKAALANA